MNRVVTASLSNLRLYGSILSPANFMTGLWNTVSRKPAPFPLSINLLITQRCNYACKMCVSTQCEKKGTGYERDLGAAVWERFIREVSPYRPVFHIGGGEPFMHRDLLEILALIKRHGLKCLMTTNGFLMEAKALEGVREFVDVVIVSLYGPREVHDGVVGVEGAFDRTLEHLKFLVRNKRQKQRIIVSCIALPESLGSFPSFLASLGALGIDTVKIEHLNFLRPEESDASLGHGCFDLTPAAFTEVRTFGAGFVQELSGLRKKIASISVPVHMKPDLEDTQLRGWYLDLPRRDPVCRFITHSVFINYNGDIIPCQFFPQCVLGNIQKDSLKEVWNSAAYRQLRKTVQDKRPKICMRCCKN